MIIWKCSVIHRGIDRDSLPIGCDLPMREAVESAFVELTGHHPEAIMSGWGQDYLPEITEAVLNNRSPSEHYYENWRVAKDTLAELGVPVGDDFTPTNSRYMAALSALTEALPARESVTSQEVK